MGASASVNSEEDQAVYNRPNLDLNSRNEESTADKGETLPISQDEGALESNMYAETQQKPRDKNRAPESEKSVNYVLQADEITMVMHFFTMALQNEKRLKEIKEKIPRLFKKITIGEYQVLFSKGSPVDGLYFIQSGKLGLMSWTDSAVCISEVLPGQFYGDVECLYRQPAAMTARTLSRTTALFLPASRLRPLLTSFDTKIEEWCVKAKHMPLYTNVDYEVWREKLILNVLSQVPLLDGWSETALLDLTTFLPLYPITLHPPGSLIMSEGDPPDRLLILLKGRLSVFSCDNFITSVQAFTIPFILGEEGFCTQSEMCLSAVATEPCWIMRLEKRWLLDIIKEEESSVKVWDEAVLEWQRLTQAREADLAATYRGFMQVEIVYKWLRETGNFGLCPPKCVYAIAKNAEPKEYIEGMFEEDFTALALLIVYEKPGKVLKEAFGAIKYTLFVSPRRQTSVEKEETEGILVLWFDVATVTKIVQSFPNAKLTLQ